MKRSNFDLSHERMLTMKPDGTLYPILCEDVVPGSIWRGNSQIFARMLPLVSPMYQRFDIYTHYFFVPYELIWENWKKFIAPETVDNENYLPDPEFHTFPQFGVHVAPEFALENTIGYNAFGAGTLPDHLGYRFAPAEQLPNDFMLTPMFSWLPFRAYHSICNEHFRDVDLEQPYPVLKSDGFVYDDEYQLLQFRKRNLEKDYFTASRPFAQRGEPVSVQAGIIQPMTNTANGQVYDAVGGGSGLVIDTDSDGFQRLGVPSIANLAEGAANVDTHTSFTIADLRWANSMQQFLEKLYRTGSRYNNYLRSFFGVNPKDMRLDRPEYIGGGRQPFNISEVLQTSQSDTTPLGTFGGRGITYGSHKFNYKVEEHGIIMGLVSIMPRISYMNGVRRHLMHSDRFDFPIPDFANIGNQAINSIESSGWLQDINGTFGYTDRYGEYKFIPSTVHGKFRTDEYLKTFHCSRIADFASLSPDFIKPDWDNDIKRVFADDSEDPILMTVQHRITANMPLPKLSIPSLF